MDSLRTKPAIPLNWLHMDEISLNLPQIRFVTPGPDGQIVLHFDSTHKLTVDGDKAKLLMQLLGKEQAQ